MENKEKSKTIEICIEASENDESQNETENERLLATTLPKHTPERKTVKFDQANLDELQEEGDDEAGKEMLSGEKIQELADEEFSKEYPDEKLYKIFMLNFFCSVMVNVDHGSLPGCSEEVKHKMKIHNLGFGLLGTAVYAGLTIGSALGTKAYQNSKSIRHILSVSLLLNALFLVMFTLSANSTFNFAIRFCTGIFQVFISIFTPVWADAFGSEKQKVRWITILLLCSPLGVFVGFTLTSIMNSYKGLGWEMSFYIQALCVLPCAFGIWRAD